MSDNDGVQGQKAYRDPRAKEGKYRQTSQDTAKPRELHQTCQQANGSGTAMDLHLAHPVLVHVRSFPIDQ
jgi:hypothetical protein